MVRMYSFLIVLLQTISGCGQSAAPLHIPLVDTLLLPLGNDTVPVHKSLYGNAPAPFFVHLHHNEITADSAAQYFLQRAGGMMISVQNDRERLMQFWLAGVRYQFDPNRIFTPAGAERSLRRLGPFASAALASVLRFSDSLLSLLPDSIPLITVHNNTHGAYSLRSYLPDGELAREAADVFLNAEMDDDDFVLTTDAKLFSALRNRGINAVLQKNDDAADDGSMGYLFSKMGRSYTNVEAEHGHLEEQLRMLQAVVEELHPK